MKTFFLSAISLPSAATEPDKLEQIINWLSSIPGLDIISLIIVIVGYVGMMTFICYKGWMSGFYERYKICSLEAEEQGNCHRDIVEIRSHDGQLYRCQRGICKKIKEEVED